MGNLKLLELKPYDSYVLGGLRNFQAGTDTYRETQPLPDIMKFFHLINLEKARFCGIFIEESTDNGKNFYLPVPADILQPRKGESGNLKISELKPISKSPLKEAILDIETNYLPYLEKEILPKTINQEEEDTKYEGASGFLDIKSLESYFVKGVLSSNLGTGNLKNLSDFIKAELKIGLTLNFDSFTAEESRLYMTFLNRLKENVKLVALLEERGSKETALKGSYYFGGETRVSKVETQPLDEKLKFLTDFVEIERGNLYRFYLTTHTYIEGELTIGKCLNIGGLNFELVWLFNAGKEWISGFRKPAIQMLKPGTVLILKAFQPGELRRLTYISKTEFVPVYEDRESKNILKKKVNLHCYGWNFGILGPYKGGK